jgi:membrane protein DedA with SNARE-associated domain
MRDLFASLLDWYLGALDQGGYLLVAALMAMESSIIPLPSEFVIPPAAHLAHSRGIMSVTGVVIAGTIG